MTMHTPVFITSNNCSPRAIDRREHIAYLHAQMKRARIVWQIRRDRVRAANRGSMPNTNLGALLNECKDAKAKLRSYCDMLHCMLIPRPIRLGV